MAGFVLGEDMEDMEDVLKLCLGLWRGTLGFAVLRYWAIFHAVFR